MEAETTLGLKWTCREAGNGSLETGGQAQENIPDFKSTDACADVKSQ